MASHPETTRDVHHSIPSAGSSTPVLPPAPSKSAEASSSVTSADRRPSPSPGFRIRLARPSDAPAICALNKASFKATFDWVTAPDDMDAYLATLRPELYEAIARDTGKRWSYVAETIPPDLAEQDARPATADGDDGPSGQIVGFIQTATEEEEECVVKGGWPKPFNLDKLYVDYGFHGGGVGRQLVTAALDEGRRRGYESCWLGVYEKNDKARRFYEKFGFQQIGRHGFWVGEDCQMDDIWILKL